MNNRNTEEQEIANQEYELEFEYTDKFLDRCTPHINKKVADTPYPFFTLMPAHGRRICYYNQDGDLVA